MEEEYWSNIKLDMEDSRYEVSTLGRVRNAEWDKFLTPCPDKNGYMRVCLYHNNKRFGKKVHRLVLQSFRPIHFKRQNQGNHLNGIKSDNRLCNLEWSTNGENGKHAYRTGLKVPLYGEDNPHNKYSEETIRRACSMLEMGKNCSMIAIELAIPYFIVHALKEGRLWKHINSEYNITRPRPINKDMFSDDEKTYIRELILQGMFPKEICNELSIDYDKRSLTAISNLRSRLKLND